MFHASFVIYINQILWCLGSFALFVGFSWFIIMPRLERFLEKRENYIRDNLAVAKSMLDKAAAINEKINMALNEAMARGNQLIDYAFIISKEYKKYCLEVTDDIIRKDEDLLLKEMKDKVEDYVLGHGDEIVKISSIVGKRIFDINFLADKELEVIVKDNLNKWQPSAVFIS